MPCKNGNNSSWERGVLMSIDDCKAKQSTTNTDSTFESTELATGVWQNSTANLGLNEFMVIKVDATQYSASVVIDDAVSVGVIY